LKNGRGGEFDELRGDTPGRVGPGPWYEPLWHLLAFEEKEGYWESERGRDLLTRVKAEAEARPDCVGFGVNPSEYQCVELYSYHALGEEGSLQRQQARWTGFTKLGPMAPRKGIPAAFLRQVPTLQHLLVHLTVWLEETQSLLLWKDWTESAAACLLLTGLMVLSLALAGQPSTLAAVFGLAVLTWGCPPSRNARWILNATAKFIVSKGKPRGAC